MFHINMERYYAQLYKDKTKKEENHMSTNQLCFLIVLPVNRPCVVKKGRLNFS